MEADVKGWRRIVCAGGGEWAELQHSSYVVCSAISSYLVVLFVWHSLDVETGYLRSQVAASDAILNAVVQRKF